MSIIKSYERDIFSSFVIAYFSHNPKAKIADLRKEIENSFERKISKWTVKKFLKSIGWSWKVPTTFHINKYSIENIENYLLFVDWIKKQDPKKLKFCDESHLVPRHMDARLVCGLKSKRVYHRNNTSHEPNSSISIITSVCRDQMPVFVDYR